MSFSSLFLITALKPYFLKGLIFASSYSFVYTYIHVGLFPSVKHKHNTIVNR